MGPVGLACARVGGVPTSCNSAQPHRAPLAERCDSLFVERFVDRNHVRAKDSHVRQKVVRIRNQVEIDSFNLKRFPVDYQKAARMRHFLEHDQQFCAGGFSFGVNENNLHDTASEFLGDEDDVLVCSERVIVAVDDKRHGYLCREGVAVRPRGAMQAAPRGCLNTNSNRYSNEMDAAAAPRQAVDVCSQTGVRCTQMGIRVDVQQRPRFFKESMA